jgi:YD repeat-containing protein
MVYGVNGGAQVRTADPYQQFTDQDFQKALAIALTESGGQHAIPMYYPGPGGPGDGGPTGTVKKNSQGQVIEVDFPNGKHRQFGYDKNGQLVRVVQPDGTVYQLVNDKWKYGQSENTGSQDPGSLQGAAHSAGLRGDPDFLNPQVSSDGTLSYQTRKGAYVNDFSDGSQTTVNKDLSIVKQDANGNVVEIDYADGSQKQFSHDAKGNITQIVENGKTYTVDHSGKIIGPDHKPTGETNPYVSSDGTYSYTDQNNNYVTINTDQSQSIRTEAGLIIRNPAGQITEIGYPGGTSRKFGYDSYGQLNTITDTDGKTYTYARPLGEWVDANGKPASFSDPTVSADGIYSYIDANDKIVVDYASGVSSTTTLTTEQISQAAADIHNDIVLSAHGSDRSAEINAILNKMSPADVAQLEEQYQNAYGVSLYSDLGRSKETAGQQILTSDGVRTAALQSRAASLQSGSYTVTLDGGPYKGWTVSSLHEGPGQDVVSLINPKNQLTEVDRPDGSKVVLTYPDPAHPDPNNLNPNLWSTLTDSQSGLTYKRTPHGIEEIGANGQVIATHSGVWVNADGTISIIDNPTQVSQLVHFDAGVSPEVQQQVIKELNNLPPNVKQMLLEDKTLIEITPDGVGPAGGYTNFPDRRLVIGSDPHFVKEAVAHEIAHAVDGYNLHITSSPGFQAAIDQDLKNGLPKDQNSYSYILVDDPQNRTYKFGEGDLYAEIAAGLLGYDQSGIPAKMMKDYPTLTAYIKQQLGLDGAGGSSSSSVGPGRRS